MARNLCPIQRRPAETTPDEEAGRRRASPPVPRRTRLSSRAARPHRAWAGRTPVRRRISVSASPSFHAKAKSAMSALSLPRFSRTIGSAANAAGSRGRSLLDLRKPNAALNHQVANIALVYRIIANEFARDQVRCRTCPNMKFRPLPKRKAPAFDRRLKTQPQRPHPFDVVAAVAIRRVDGQPRRFSRAPQIRLVRPRVRPRDIQIERGPIRLVQQHAGGAAVDMKRERRFKRPVNALEVGYDIALIQCRAVYPSERPFSRALLGPKLRKSQRVARPQPHLSPFRAGQGLAGPSFIIHTVWSWHGGLAANPCRSAAMRLRSAGALELPQNGARQGPRLHGCVTLRSEMTGSCAKNHGTGARSGLESRLAAAALGRMMCRSTTKPRHPPPAG